MTEQQIQSKILKYLEANNFYVFKTINTNKRGVPDIIALYDGKYIAIEVKRRGNRPTQLQEEHLSMIENAGGIAMVAYSLDEVKEQLDYHQIYL